MKHIVLIGDSIFDNASYVGKGESVIDQLQDILPDNCKATLLAVDGDVTHDVHTQLKNLPKDTSHVFLSVGGNDALRVANVLSTKVSRVGEAMELLTDIKSGFQSRYKDLLKAVKKKTDKLSILTVHDSVPSVEDRALTALALFNEVILREAFLINSPVIDLRVVCNEVADYSEVSPIEPSGQGAEKIVKRILDVIEKHDFVVQGSSIYIN